MSFIETLLALLISGILGYFIGKVKEFRESKQKIYTQIIPTIAEMCFNPQADRVKEYNSAILSSWLFSNKKLAKKIDALASILIDPSRGNMINELQELIVEMRKDIQPFFWQNLKAKDVKHIYTKIVNRIGVINENHLEETIKRLIKLTKNDELPWFHTFGDAHIILELRQGIIEIWKSEDLLSQETSFSVTINFEGNDYFNEHINKSKRLYLLVDELYNIVKTGDNNEFNKLFIAIANKDFKTTKRIDDSENENNLPF
ncbi:MAG: hypothetical protein ABI638_01210 [Ignavibacteriota bacterium]